MNEINSSATSLIDVVEFGEQMDKGIVLFDLQKLSISYFNTKAESLLGPLAAGNAVNYFHLLARVFPEHQQYVQEQFHLLLRERKSREIKFRMASRSDKHYYLLLNCAIYFLTKSYQLLLFIEDISARQEQEVLQLEFNSRKNTLLETVMHHISGALMLMQQLARQAEKSVASTNNEDVIHYISLLKANAESCVSMVDGLLKEENAKTPEMTAKIEQVELVERLQCVYENLVQAYPARNIIFDSQAPVAYAHTDEFKALQIVNNFIYNAIKFTPAEKPIVIAIYQTEDHTVISVEDEGIGIPVQLQPFLFRRNSSASRVGLAGEISHGYGLYISRLLAASINASIEFETNENQGSVFYLLIPRLK